MFDKKGHAGWRYAICGFSKSNLEQKRSCPRAAQTLFSRYRMGSVDSCGSYPRHLGYLPKGSLCRFCSVAKETPYHLLRSCPGTANYRSIFGLSLKTLHHDTPSNMLDIALFDDYITTVHPVQKNQFQQRLTTALVTFLDQKRELEPSSPDSMPSILGEPATKRQCGSRRRRTRLIISSSTQS